MAWNSRQMFSILQKSADIAVAAQNSTQTSTKLDGTIVTEADKQVEALICEEIRSLDPSAYIIGEETFALQDSSYFEQALAQTCYVIDPIDGTTLYAHGLPAWGISVGYLHKGRFSEGAILFPTSGEVLVSQGQSVLYAQEPSYASLSYELLRPLKAPHSDSTVITVNQAVVKHGRYKGKLTVLSTGSCVSSLLYLIRGSILGYISHSKLWDLAGGFPLLHKLGLTAYTLHGEELAQNIEAQHWHIPTKPQAQENPAQQNPWMLRQPILFCKNRKVLERIVKDMQP